MGAFVICDSFAGLLCKSILVICMNGLAYQICMPTRQCKWPKHLYINAANKL